MGDAMIVVGSINTDLVVKSERIPAPGENICGKGFQMVPGGKGANQAVAARRLGAEVFMVGCVGKDLFGDFLISNLEACGVSADLVKRADVPTGTALIVVEEKTGVNTIVVDPGANMALTTGDLAVLRDERSKACCALFQLEIPEDVVVEGSRMAKERGLLAVLDAGPPRGEVIEAIRYFDIVSPNLNELASLTGQEVYDLRSAKEASMRLVSAGVPTVVVKMAQEGALLVDDGRALHFPAFEVEAVDATAAGDAFTAALAFFLSRGKPLEESIFFANAAGACAVKVFGAQPSMPDINAVVEMMSSRRNECFSV